MQSPLCSIVRLVWDVCQVRDMDPSLVVLHTDDLSPTPVLVVRSPYRGPRTGPSPPMGQFGEFEVHVMHELKDVLLYQLVR